MKTLLEMLYPRQCLGCGAEAPKTFSYICWECWADTVQVEPPFCAVCGDPVPGAVDHGFTCFACSASRPAFQSARSAFRYEGVVGEALRQLKYHRALWLAADLAEILYRCVEAEYPDIRFDAVVPVPLHHTRRRARGYNQAALLARELARRLDGLPVPPRLVRRTRPTATQTNLTAAQRLDNMRGAFESGKRERLAGRRVLLVDDVMTTGATVNACAKALKKGGAESVHVVTVARG